MQSFCPYVPFPHVLMYLTLPTGLAFPAEGFLDDAGEVEAFERMDFLLDTLRGVFRGQRYTYLRDNPPLITLVAHEMDGDTTLRLPGGDDSLMDMPAIHSLAAELRKQRRMDVDYTLMVTLYEKRWYHQEKTRKDNDINAISLQNRKHPLRVAYFGPRQNLDRHIQARGAANHTGFRLVADHKHHLTPTRGILKMAYDVLGIRAVAGGKDCYTFHIHYRSIKQ